MANLDELMSKIDIGQVAEMLEVDRPTAQRTVKTALESLVSAVGDRAGDAEAAMGLANALTDHVGSNRSAKRIDIGSVDATDGGKILGHLFEPEQLQQLSAGQSGSLVERLMPYLAPVVMEMLADQFSDYIKERTGLPLPSSRRGTGTTVPSGGGILGSILDQILGGRRPHRALVQAAQGHTPERETAGGRRRSHRVPTETGKPAGLDPAGSALRPLTRTKAPGRTLRFILASSSPARLETLRRAGVVPTVHAPQVDEAGVSASTTQELVARLARLKGNAVLTELRVDDAVVVACDSLLELDGRPVGKPGSPQAAVDTWRAIRGRQGELWTGTM